MYPLPCGPRCIASSQYCIFVFFRQLFPRLTALLAKAASNDIDMVAATCTSFASVLLVRFTRGFYKNSFFALFLSQNILFGHPNF